MRPFRLLFAARGALAIVFLLGGASWVRGLDFSEVLSTPEPSTPSATVTLPVGGTAVSEIPAATAIPAVTDAVVASGAVTLPAGGVASAGAAPMPLGDVIASLAIRDEHRGGYDRDLFPHWTSTGGGCDVRDTVLINEANGTAQVDVNGCQVLTGDWISQYDGVTTSDPRALQIDHVVALVEAWDSGAHAWSEDRRRSFANDLADSRSLIAVTAESNQEKSGSDITEWIPTVNRCAYVADVVAIKARWGLSVDYAERDALDWYVIGECAGTMVAPWPAAPS